MPARDPRWERLNVGIPIAISVFGCGGVSRIVATAFAVKQPKFG